MYRADIENPGDWPFRPDHETGGVLRYDRRRGAWQPCGGTMGSDGYPMTTWTPQGQQRRYLRLHAVVWRTWHGPVPDGMEIDHIDGDKGHCVVDNLQLLTHRENITKARAMQGNWTPSKLTQGQKCLVLALPAGWRCLPELAIRWGVSKFSLGNMRAKAKRDGDPMLYASLDAYYA